MSLDCGRKPEHPEKSPTAHKKNPADQSDQVERTVLITALSGSLVLTECKLMFGPNDVILNKTSLKSNKFNYNPKVNECIFWESDFLYKYI